MEVWEFIRQYVPFVAEGGVVILIQWGVSLIGVALILERTYTLRRRSVAPRSWLDQIRGMVRAGGFAALADPTQWPDVRAARVLRQFLAHPLDKVGEAREHIDWLTGREFTTMQSGLNYLGLLAALSPLLGLLGTVTGMIRTFRSIAGGNIGDPRALANGIYEALYTTAFGLSLAIPLTIAHRALKSRAGKLAEELAEFLEEIWWLNRAAPRHSDRDGDGV